MRMHAAFTRGLVLPLVLLSLLATAPLAHAAVWANHSGTICKNYNAGDVSYIDYLTYGTRSFKGSATQVICPLTRNTSNSNGAFVDVDILHLGTQTTSCTAFSLSPTGSLMGSTGQSWTGSGWHVFAIDLTGIGKSDSRSNYSVLCTIPGNGLGLVIDLELVEQ